MVLMAAAWVPAKARAEVQVRLERTPSGGIQPQAVVDDRGWQHLIYFKGDPGAGDIFYTTRTPGSGGFSEPRQVNHRAGSAVAMGTIRGAQLAVGKNGRAHVIWNGSQKAAPDGDHHKAPLYYTRLKEDGTGFEPERNVITFAWGLDGGSSIAADRSGHVFVTWHASPPGNTEGEAGRAVFIARSTNEGVSFTPEEQANPEPTGACGCCGMKAFADMDGRVSILYRAAGEKVDRDQIWLMAEGPDAPFKVVYRHPWKIATCPMSSAWLSGGSRGMLAAWETDRQVHVARLRAGGLSVSEPVTAPGNGKRKFPVAIENALGEWLLVWAEGTGWGKGGRLAWQVFDAEGSPTRVQGETDGLPVWSLPTAMAEQDGTFTIIY
jgi:hypothetical protein